MRNLLVLIALLLYSAPSYAQRVVRLAAGEHMPYIGAGLPNQGYAAEVVQQAFKREGYDTDLGFYPQARAELLVRQGGADVLLPAYRDDSVETDLLYSDPFPGDTLGLLKRKSLAADYGPAVVGNPQNLQHLLAGSTVGVVRGGAGLAMLSNMADVNLQASIDDLGNIDKLAAGAIQYALIDKYTAADLLTSQRPQLVGDLEFLTPPLATKSFRIALSAKSPGAPALLAAFNAGLKAMRNDGTLARLQAAHGLQPPASALKGKVRLSIATVANPDMVVMQELSKSFEKQYPDIQLEWHVLDENTLRVRVLGDVAIDDGQFDVLTIGTYEAPLWAKRGWLLPLDGLPPDYDVDDLLPTVRAGLSYRKQLYALPFYGESSMTYYRKDLFAKAGLTMPAKPSYDDIARFAARIHNPSAGVYGICLRGLQGWGENMAFVSTLVNAYGGQWFDSRWAPQLDSPAWQKAIAYYRNVLTNYGPPHPERNGFTQNLALFSQGRCGMWIDATVAAGMLFDPKQSKVADQLGFAPAPMAVTDRGSAWLWSWALAVSSASSHPKEAKTFIAWATSKGYIQEVARARGWVTVPPGTRRSTYQTEAYLKAAPFAQFVLRAIESADIANSTINPKPYLGIQVVEIPEFEAIGTQVGGEIAKMLAGKQSVKEGLARAQALTLRQMKASGYLQ